MTERTTDTEIAGPTGDHNYFAEKTQLVASEPERPNTDRIAVTGGSGFIGTNLIDFYLANGVTSIVNWDIASPRTPRHRHLWQSLDIRDPDNTKSAVTSFKPSVVFHLAARTDLDGQTPGDYAANANGTGNLIDSFQALSRPPKVIFASSQLVCKTGHVPSSEDDYCPTTAYGESKVAMERLVRQAAGTAFQWFLVRPTSIWGPWFGVPFRQFFEAVLRGWYIHPRRRPVMKSYGFVGNTIVQLHSLMHGNSADLTHRTFYLADYPPIEFYAWASEIADRGGQRVRTAPLGLLKFLARLGDAARRLGIRSVPLTSFRLENLLAEMVYDTYEIQAVTGSLPFSQTEGIRLTVEWLRGQRESSAAGRLSL